MNCTRCSEKLFAYALARRPAPAAGRDDALTAAELRAVEEHLAGCPSCRAELESSRRLQAATAALPREFAPARDLWSGISAGLETAAAVPDGAFGESSALARRGARRSRWRPLYPFLPLAVAATVAVVCTFVAQRPAGISGVDAPAWSVSTVAGAPRVAARRLGPVGPFRVGQWLETDAASRAKIDVGSIGEVRVEPNSRVRLVGTAATDHRIELARGTVDAVIWAPPRLFFVDTPSATAVDLGCAYTLSVDDRGDGELHVTAGYVALEHAGRESIIPFGFQCLTRRGAGPGTPFAPTAPAELRAALEAFDFGPSARRPESVSRVLASARPDDAVTVWHLLARADAQRAAVFDTLARLAAPPEGVTRAGILAGDAAMRQAWGTALGLGPFR